MLMLPVGRACLFSGPSDLDGNRDGVGRRSMRVDGGSLLAEVLIITSVVVIIFAGVAPFPIQIETFSRRPVRS